MICFLKHLQIVPPQREWKPLEQVVEGLLARGEQIVRAPFLARSVLPPLVEQRAYDELRVRKLSPDRFALILQGGQMFLEAALVLFGCQVCVRREKFGAGNGARKQDVPFRG